MDGAGSTATKIVISDWHIDYKHNRPHSGLGHVDIIECAQRWKNRSRETTPRQALALCDVGTTGINPTVWWKDLRFDTSMCSQQIDKPGAVNEF